MIIYPSIFALHLFLTNKISGYRAHGMKATFLKPLLKLVDLEACVSYFIYIVDNYKTENAFISLLIPASD